MVTLPATSLDIRADRLSRELALLLATKVENSCRVFLLNQGAITKSSPPLQLASLTHVRPNFMRVFKIILVSLRKSIPLLKVGDAAYSSPMAVVLPRNEAMEFTLGIPLRVLTRYLRFIKLTEFLVDKNLPISLRFSPYTNPNLPPLGTPEGVLVRIKPLIGATDERTVSSSNIFLFYLNFYSILFSLPETIKVLRTLHRCSYFKEVSSPPENTNNSIDIPF